MSGPPAHPLPLLVLFLVACAHPPNAPVVALRADKLVRARAARVDVHYVELASPGAVHTPVVLLHPWGADLDIWMDVAPELSADRRTVLVDLPGHGASSHPPGRYPPRRLAQGVLAVLDDAGIERAVLVGNSIGGGTALALAELAPQRVAGLVLVGAPGGAALPDTLRDAAGRAVNPAALATVSPAVIDALWRAVSGGDTPALSRVAQRARAQREAPDWSLRAGALASALEEVIRFAPALEALRVPTLVIHGEDDRVVWASAGRALAARIAGAELAMLPSCGHFPEAECPEQFMPPLRAFLARVDGR